MKPLYGTELKRFLRDYRRDRPPRRQLAAVLQSVEYPYNVGSIFRLAEGVGMAQLILTGITPTPPHPTITKLGRSKDRRVPWRYESDAVEAITGLKQQGFRVIAIELTAAASPYHAVDYPSHVAMVVGHEDHGVTKATLQACDQAVFIPMYGKGLSLNVHTALAVVSYHIAHAS
ncbi:MAG: TrmH family RNA methyltransferase [Candidatus Promineifilaceae bacterium]|nr:TrmH family RNA methyltransferase [Candidatus Promineifilaceae bacterium]